MKTLITYVLTWFLVLAVAAGVNLTGNSGELMETIFGFIYVTLFFAGAASVIPYGIDQRLSRKF